MISLHTIIYNYWYEKWSLSSMCYYATLHWRHFDKSSISIRALICFAWNGLLITFHISGFAFTAILLGERSIFARHKGSNTGKRARRKNLRHPRERFLVSNEAPSSWRPIEIFPVGVWDFSALPSYRCFILFLTNFPILYVFRCLILFLTKRLCFVYIPSSVFLQNCFPLVKLIVDLSIYIRVLAVF